MHYDHKAPRVRGAAERARRCRTPRGRSTFPAARPSPSAAARAAAVPEHPAAERLRRERDRWSVSRSRRFAECELGAYLSLAIRPDDAGEHPEYPAGPGRARVGGVGRTDGREAGRASTGSPRAGAVEALVGVLVHREFDADAGAAVAGGPRAPLPVRIAAAMDRLDAALAGLLGAAPGPQLRRAARDRLRECLVGLARSPLLRDLATCAPEEAHVGADGPPHEFRLDGGQTTLRVAPDLLYRHHDPRTCGVPIASPTWVVVEVKTSSCADPRAVKRQLAAYALWALQARGLPGYRGGFLARVVRPRDFVSDSWVVLTGADLDGVRAAVAADRARVDAGLARLAAGVPDLAAFPATVDPGVCARCDVARHCPLRAGRNLPGTPAATAGRDAGEREVVRRSVREVR